ncbi:MAG TPA: methyl-coenzyme M reductase subunit alpha, partial [Halobacteria archaeon]|nr:methyl-coenzyme M reductase subunit alpha [Halobacteria archaeon]
MVEDKKFIKALSKKFTEDPKGRTMTKVGLGIDQSARKREFKEWGEKIAKERGISGYDPMVHLGGIPLGQRVLMPYKISTTDAYCEGDDLHFVNNAAMQQ